MVSEKIFDSLDRELQIHIGVKQGESWYVPPDLAKHCDIYVSSKFKNDSNVFSKPQVVNHSQKYRKEYSTQKVFLSEVKTSKCVVCKSTENHSLNVCPVFKDMLVNERIEVVKNKQLCFNCLNHHKVANCYSKSNCFICKKRHNSLLHLGGNEIETRPQNASVALNPKSNVFVPRIENRNSSSNTLQLSNESLADRTHSFTATSSNVNKMALLSTANVMILNNVGTFTSARALLDVGSMSHFLSKRLADKLNLKKEKRNIVVSGLNQSSYVVNRIVKTKISNVSGSFEKEIELLVVPQITDHLPSREFDINTLEVDSFNLADVSFNKPGEVDILLGAQIFYELLRAGQIRFPGTDIVFQNTVFGFVASGSVPIENESTVHCGLIIEDLDANLRKFWEIEEVEVDKVKNEEAEICEKHYAQTHKRDKEGRYIVTIPFREEPTCLGNSKNTALKRLDSLWKRLVKDPEYLSLYKEFLREYEELGHMREVSELEEPSAVYYMPHHGVYRPQKPTTKLRIVFNASSVTTNRNSLNSLQLNGGVIQDDLFSIMTRFRKHIFAFTADIKMMYRMIKIHPSQRSLQRILWKKGIDEPVKIYELSTVTYGTVSAPNLAMRTLKQIAIDEGENFPLAAPVLLSEFYMDDVLTGAQSLLEAKELQHQLIEILNSAGMTLHKWCSNNSELAVDENSYPFSNVEETTALGVLKSKEDCFSFQVKLEEDAAVTKRHVLSTIARLFDPLGLLGPIITKAKIFLQRLWLLKADWDDQLPEKEAEEWRRFSTEMKLIVPRIKIERCIFVAEALLIELHGFSDASEMAYGAAIFAKSTTASGDVKVRLISSKSRVAPMKQVTIPRLELCGALLVAKLMKKVRTALKLDISAIHFWADSSIVISWIRKESRDLKTFVANRVAKIQELTSVDQWHHIPSEQNPADLISRGVSPEELCNNSLWWNGPGLLQQSEYPNYEFNVTNQGNQFDCELKLNSDSKCAFIIQSNTFVTEFLNLSNNYAKLIRILSFLFRFYNNCRKHKGSGPLQPEEIREAEFRLIRLIQQQVFAKELSCLRKNDNVAKDSEVRSLHPWVDEKGVLRVGGRLANCVLRHDKKFPIILPKNHKLSELIVDMYHKKYLHIGPQGLLFLLRHRFWPLNGRNLCRKITHNCVVCFKAKPVTGQQVMGQLPIERITPNFPFNCVGVDFCGPFHIKYPNQRKGTLFKVFICIFVCFATKACHLELVNDLSTNAFIATLKRFFSRRGKCSHIFSDNATNFVGSDLEIKRLINLVKKPNECLSNFLCNEGIKWNFIPPRAPNHGGLWEAAVKSVKYHLKRVVGNHKLTYEEFLTITTQVEGILNSRPLCPLTAELDDFEVLTPGHFLIGRAITTIPEPNVINVPENRLKIWQKLTKLIQVLWKNWSNNYLTTLQQRNKWFFDRNNVKVGDMVIVREDNLVVCKWPLGRIVEIFPGKDNKVRVVTVKTKDGQFKRPISKICLLPISENTV